jgi:phage-related protein
MSRERVEEVAEGIKEAVRSAEHTVHDVAETVSNKVVDVARSAEQTVHNAAETVSNAVVDTVDKAKETVISVLDAVEAAADAAYSTLNSVREKIDSELSKIKESILTRLAVNPTDSKTEPVAVQDYLQRASDAFRGVVSGLKAQTQGSKEV